MCVRIAWYPASTSGWQILWQMWRNKVRLPFTPFAGASIRGESLIIVPTISLIPLPTQSRTEGWSDSQESTFSSFENMRREGRPISLWNGNQIIVSTTGTRLIPSLQIWFKIQFCQYFIKECTHNSERKKTQSFQKSYKRNLPLLRF